MMGDGSRMPLTGRKILLVEDEYFIVDDLVRSFKASGADVLGPAASLHEALLIVTEAPRIDGAVIDLNLQGEMAFNIADRLHARGVPFVFATGYDQTMIPERFAQVRRFEKPVEPNRIAEALLA